MKRTVKHVPRAADVINARRDGCQLAEIAQRFNASVAVITRVLRESKEKGLPKYIRFTALTRRRIARYLSDHEKICAMSMAREVGISPSHAQKCAKQAGKLKLILNYLTPEQRTEARRLYASGKWTQCGLAEKFGVNQATISRAVSGVKKAKRAA